LIYCKPVACVGRERPPASFTFPIAAIPAEPDRISSQEEWPPV